MECIHSLYHSQPVCEQSAVCTGVQQESNNRFSSPFLTDFQSTDSSLSHNRAIIDPVLPEVSSQPLKNTELSQAAQLASASTVAVGVASTSDTAVTSPTTAADGEKPKKGHRRGRSLTGLIPTLNIKPKRSQSQFLEVRFLVAQLHTWLHCPSLEALKKGPKRRPFLFMHSCLSGIPQAFSLLFVDNMLPTMY